MKKTVLLIPLALGVLFWVYNSPKEVVKISKTSTTHKIETTQEFSSTQTDSDSSDDERLLDDKKLLSQDEPFLSLEIPKDRVKSEPIEIMSEIAIDDLKISLPPREDVKPVMAIAMNSEKVLHLTIGDEIEIPLPNGVYRAIIESKKINPSISLALTGNLEDDDNNNYSITLTQGKRSVFATVTSPDGAFEIEVKDGKGYIYRTSDIKKNIDYTQSDEIWE